MSKTIFYSLSEQNYILPTQLVKLYFTHSMSKIIFYSLISQNAILLSQKLFLAVFAAKNIVRDSIEK